jgi:hypothetical protein
MCEDRGCEDAADEQDERMRNAGEHRGLRAMLTDTDDLQNITV